MKQFKWIIIVIAGLTLIAVVAGVSAFSFISQASAQSVMLENVDELADPVGPQFQGRRGPGEDAEFLAKALGISVEELQTAHEKAQKAAIQQALEEGLITQAQADRLSGRGFPPGRGLGALLVGPDSGIDMDALLAEALGITAAELQEAREQAFSDSLAQGVADGRISEEQAELMKAHHALRDYIKPDELMAQALGITKDQLQSYHEQGLSFDEIIAELGLTEEQVSDAHQAALEAVIGQAAEEGIITQAQADLVLNNPMGMQPFSRIHGHEANGGLGRAGRFGLPEGEPPARPGGSGL